MTDTTTTVLDAIATDWRPSRQDSREAIRAAVHLTAGQTHPVWEVHIAEVRQFLPAWVVPAQVGAFINRLARRGYLIQTGQYRPNGDTHSRNGNKPSPVWRLTKPIPVEETH